MRINHTFLCIMLIMFVVACAPTDNNTTSLIALPTIIPTAHINLATPSPTHESFLLPTWTPIASNIDIYTPSSLTSEFVELYPTVEVVNTGIRLSSDTYEPEFNNAPNDILDEVMYFIGGGGDGVYCGDIKSPEIVRASNLFWPRAIYVDSCGWETGDMVLIQLYDPNKTYFEYTKKVEEGGELSFSYQIDLNSPLGEYQVTILSKTHTLNVTIEVKLPNTPYIVRYSEEELLLLGFKPSEQVRVFEYIYDDLNNVHYNFSMLKLVSWKYFYVNEQGLLLLNLKGLNKSFYSAVGNDSGQAQNLTSPTKDDNAADDLHKGVHIPSLSHEAYELKIFVDANIPLNGTYIKILKGQTVTIQYISGSWRAGPLPIWPYVDAGGDIQVLSKDTFPISNQPVMFLIAGVGKSPPIEVGYQKSFVSEYSGYLWLGANDDNFTDNDGELTVLVKVAP